MTDIDKSRIDPLARPGDCLQPWVKRADLAACKRSIVRYLQRYEREWERSPVSIRGCEMTFCAPPEEGGAWMTAGRVRIALGQLVTEGLLSRRRARGTGYRYYALTDPGRRADLEQIA